MTELSETAKNFNWLIDDFVNSTAGVTDAIAVSSDGLLIAASRSLERQDAEQVAAIVTGMVSLSEGASRAFGFEGLQQVIVSMRGGYMFVSSISMGSALGVVATNGCDIGAIGYQTGLLVERVGELLTPELISELRVSVVS
ncbi:MAG: roadblock/LC7 domain-containing protein [Acidimicrobiales bacterium]|nr:roadblock/LC7 domain-containing protein [Acidimicrobiales bacterium]HMS88685.1 roadblock/LC7 domain-containing protein [Acidimicrobiales bacterium]